MRDENVLTREISGQTLQRLQVAVDSIRTAVRPRRTGSLTGAIAQIRDAVMRSFVRQRPRYSRFLRALEHTGVPLGALSVCGRGTREIRYTQLLAYFLSPIEPHGLGAKVLECIFDPELRAAGITDINPSWRNSKVEAESSLGPLHIGDGDEVRYSTIDLLVTTPSLVILIEHKINSAEQGSVSSGEISQLRRYSQAFDRNFPSLKNRKRLKLYMTPDGRAPKEALEWRPLPHRCIVTRLITLLRDADMTETARHNLRSFLWDLVCGPVAVNAERREQLQKRLRDALKNPRRLPQFKRWIDEAIPAFDDLLILVERSPQNV